jgi:metallo-beta-lactamase class B
MAVPVPRVPRVFGGVALLLLCTASARAQFGSDWHTPFPSFRIAGNLHYVGTADLAAYLVTTPQGHILINSNFAEDLPALKASIARLGFAYRDIRILLTSHAHDDHAGGMGLIQKETGAAVMVMEGDAPVVGNTAPGWPGARVDRVLRDGDTVELGGATLTARLTPGHTEGCTTWTMPVTEGGSTLNAVIIGSANVNYGYLLVDNQEYPSIAQDYEKTFAVLKGLRADIFLGAHGEYFGLKEKYEVMKAGSTANPFVDPAGYAAYVADREGAFRAEWELQKK